MAKPYFTLNLDVVGKPCLIIGGDEEALEKSERLVEAEAVLTVVGRKIIPELEAFCAKHKLDLQKREFKDSDIPGMFFVLNCVKTEPALSERIYKLSLENHAIISAYDQPQYSNAVMQALVRAGKMRIAIGTGGSSPGIASAVRKSFEGIFDQEFAQFMDWVVEMRECAVEKGDTPKMRKTRFREMLKDFKIEGKISYPKAYEKQKGKIEERDGIFYSK